jgi:hypothetical protein
MVGSGTPPLALSKSSHNNNWSHPAGVAVVVSPSLLLVAVTLVEVAVDAVDSALSSVFDVVADDVVAELPPWVVELLLLAVVVVEALLVVAVAVVGCVVALTLDVLVTAVDVDVVPAALVELIDTVVAVPLEPNVSVDVSEPDCVGA